MSKFCFFFLHIYCQNTGYDNKTRYVILLSYYIISTDIKDTRVDASNISYANKDSLNKTCLNFKMCNTHSAKATAVRLKLRDCRVLSLYVHWSVIFVCVDSPNFDSYLLFKHINVIYRYISIVKIIKVVPNCLFFSWLSPLFT